jgi:hypothetical protein
MRVSVEIEKERGMSEIIAVLIYILGSPSNQFILSAISLFSFHLS